MDTNIRAIRVAYEDKNIEVTLDADGIVLARIDMPGRAMNVFSMDMMDSLERLLDYVDATNTVKGTVITSGKSTFLVGADLEMIRMFTREARTATFSALHELCGRLGRLFRRLEKSHKPYIAAVNGLALGGGLEVTLACHERVVANDKGVQLGLPEIKLGLLPGAGGTQRLPRLIDKVEAMRLLLIGDPVPAAKAMELGLVHEVVAPAELIDAAKRRAVALSNPLAPWDAPGRTFDASPFDFSAPDAFAVIAAKVGVREEQRKHYPAYDAIMKCVTGGWNKPMDAACHWEMDVFVDLIRNPVAGNMVRTLFLNRQRATKEGAAPKSLADARVAVSGSQSELIRELLAKAKAPLIDTSELGDSDIVLAPDAWPISGKHVAWLRDPEGCVLALDAQSGVWLANPTEHGLAAEVLVQGDQDALDAGKKVAQWLRATVLVTKGRLALFPRLNAARAVATKAGCSEAEVLLAVALAAATAWAEGTVADVEIADVAVVLAGLHPAYTGGPYTYLRQMGKDRAASAAMEAARREKTLFVLPEKFDDLFQYLDRIA